MSIKFVSSGAWGDNSKATFGDSQDLEIYHDGSNSYIAEASTGSLIISSDNEVQVLTSTSEVMADFNANGSVILFHDNDKKLATLSTGAVTYGQHTATPNKSIPSFSFEGDTDTGIVRTNNTADTVGIMCGTKNVFSMQTDGRMFLDKYDSASVATTGSLSANQNFQAPTQDTLATLTVDPSGNVVRGEQEATWTFTRAQLNATLGNTLIAAPGADKAVVVTYSDWMIKYSATGAVSTSQSYVVRQANIPQAAASVSILPALRINEILNASQGTPTNPSYGFYTRDIPTGSGSQGRTYKTNTATTLHKATSDALPAGVISISIKLRYRLFDGSTF